MRESLRVDFPSQSLPLLSLHLAKHRDKHIETEADREREEREGESREQGGHVSVCDIDSPRKKFHTLTQNPNVNSALAHSVKNSGVLFPCRSIPNISLSLSLSKQATKQRKHSHNGSPSSHTHSSPSLRDALHTVNPPLWVPFVFPVPQPETQPHRWMLFLKGKDRCLLLATQG